MTNGKHPHPAKTAAKKKPPAKARGGTAKKAAARTLTKGVK
jgi:hypothetical protein